MLPTLEVQRGPIGEIHPRTAFPDLSLAYIEVWCPKLYRTQVSRGLLEWSHRCHTPIGSSQRGRSTTLRSSAYCTSAQHPSSERRTMYSHNLPQVKNSYSAVRALPSRGPWSVPILKHSPVASPSVERKMFPPDYHRFNTATRSVLGSW